MTEPHVNVATRSWAAPVLIAIGAAVAVAWTFESPQALGWTLLVPGIVWLGFRFPFERHKLPRVVAVHVAAFTLIIALALLSTSLELIAGDKSPGVGGPPPWVIDAYSKGTNAMAGPPWRRGGGPPLILRVLLGLVVYVALANIGQSLAWSRRARARERQVQLAESALTRAKLDALRMQINPHFLFNCLNSIATLIHTDSHAADAMLGDLSTLLRAALASSNTPQTSLRQELEFLDRYLGIERRRFGSRLQFERVVSAECLEASVPTFILQPLAENAVKHGVETHAGSGLIRIGAKRVGDFLHIEVGNSGAGRVHDREHTNRQGIGIANTRARLEQTYGPQQHLSIENNLGGEFVVTMRIPFQTQPAA